MRLADGNDAEQQNKPLTLAFSSSNSISTGDRKYPDFFFRGIHYHVPLAHAPEMGSARLVVSLRSVRRWNLFLGKNNKYTYTQAQQRGSPNRSLARPITFTTHHPFAAF